MRITIIAIGTRGDVQPYVAFGVGLQNAGHTVRMATHANFETLVRSHGLGFSPVGGDARTFHQGDEVRALFNGKSGPPNSIRQFARLIAPHIQQTMIDVWQACQGAEALVASPLGLGVGLHVAEKLRVPLVRGFYLPGTPTSSYPRFAPNIVRLGGRFNLLTHLLFRQFLWLLVRTPSNQARADVLDLPPLPLIEPFGQLDRRRQLLLYCYSAAVLPPPTDWGDWIHVTGYWFLDQSEDWQPPSGLLEFLDSGPPPVFVGFGSMPNENPDEATRLVVMALAASKQRGILVRGWGGLTDSDSDEVYVIDDVPHDWLFPQMAAAVHHGGMGTTAASLRAGIPTVVIPFFADQHFWGQRVYELGVGPRPIPHRHLTVERLAQAIGVAMSDRSIREHAGALGRRIREENGVARAVEAFQSHVASSADTSRQTQ